MPKDWLAWHDAYESDASPLRLRLAVVQGHVRNALDASSPGPIRVLSICAGQGRDLLDVLVDHPRREDVIARLVETDDRNIEVARTRVQAAGLNRVEVIRADASSTTAYADLVPADLLLVCGVFGNIADADIHASIAILPTLCAPAATVVWTRYPRDAALLPTINGWFDEAGFALLAQQTGVPGRQFGVGVHRLTTPPPPYLPGVRMFTFLDDPDPMGFRLSR